MLVIEVHINGKHVATAGREDLSILDAVVTAFGVLGHASRGTRGITNGYRLNLHVGGLASDKEKKTKEYPRWVPQLALVPGDVVSLRYCESDLADLPVDSGKYQETRPRIAKLAEGTAIAVDVEVNGKHLLCAGREDLSVLTVGLSCSGKRFVATSPRARGTSVFFSVSGLACGAEEKDNTSIQWPGGGFLSPWDARVTIRVLTTDGIDPPLDPPIDPALTRRMLADYKRLEHHKANEKSKMLRRATQRRFANRMRLTKVRMRIR